MEFELRKIKYFDEMSEETPCFTAEIWENGKEVAYVKNSGHGGGNEVHNIPNVTTYEDVKKFDNLDVECDIFDRVWEDFDVRRLQSKGWVLKKEGKIYTAKFPMSITKLKKHSKFISWRDVEVKRNLAEGFQVLNRNLNL